MQKLHWAFTFIAILLLLAACQPAPTPTPTPTPLPPTFTPTATDTATPTPTATDTPSPEPSPIQTQAATLTPTATPGSAAANLPFAYGWDVAYYAAYQPAAGVAPYPPTSFNWLKISIEPEKAEALCNQFKLGQGVLLQLHTARAGVSTNDVFANALSWAQQLHQHDGGEKCVEAFEIGSGPNLSGAGQYGGPVNPAAYADQLCAAYDAIKSVDPTFIVVSGGLAPTAGETIDYLDEETFTRRMLDHIREIRGRPEACFDAFGYHNYGFRTGYATDPADAANCPDGLCFRGIERLHALLANEYGITYPLWTTDSGWMRDFVAGGCEAVAWAPPFSGFPVSDAAQAENLVGAFQYARANWPWLGALFVANLDYNARPEAPDPCQDADGWFAVKGFPAEAALEAMAKP